MPEPPTIAATPVGATVSIEGNSYGNLTVAPITPALDAETSVNARRGDDDPVDFRSSEDSIWLRLQVELDCRGGSSGQDCRFGLDQDVIRIEVDGVRRVRHGAGPTLFEIGTALARAHRRRPRRR
jgi:hypothetical protein